MNTDEIISKVWTDGVVIVDASEKEGIEMRSLLKEGIICVPNGNNFELKRYDKVSQKTEQPDARPYIMPDFFDEVYVLAKLATKKYRSFNILLTGPAGCGKSEFVREIATRTGFAKVFQINGRSDMDSTDFYGDKTVRVDDKTGQNFVTFAKGPLYQAFIEGTELDENGDQILYDENGNVSDDGFPKVVGNPGLFFLDEFAAVMPEIFLSVFNRAGEKPRRDGDCRTIEITGQSGKIVKSHPGFSVFLAGNTAGRGTDSVAQMVYTAQNNQMDESTISRFTATYEFGYNGDAEKSIIMSKLNDDFVAEKLIDFCNEIRKAWKTNSVDTLITTRDIVKICDLAEAFREVRKDYIPQAIYRSVFCTLRDRERAGWNELIRIKYGVDLLLNAQQKSKNVFYAKKDE